MPSKLERDEATVAAGISYRLLGPLGARTAAGQEIDLGPPKQRAVLALLLLFHGRVVSSDRLIDAVWPQGAPPSANASLQVYISNLRRLLRDGQEGPPPIVRRAPGYVLDIGSEQLDLTLLGRDAAAARSAVEQCRWDRVMAAADRALVRARGPLLADLADEHWVRAEAEQVADLLADVREMRITALLAEGSIAEAARQAAALHAEQPLRDRSCWLNMVALHRAGRSPEALECYAQHSRRLDAELGLEPGVELRDLQVAVLRHDPEIAAWPRAAAGVIAPAAVTAAAQAPAAAAPTEPHRLLVGRARETSEIASMRAEVDGGQVRWMLLSGPAGIGKTRLAEEVGRTGGGSEVWARCPEEAGAPAWWPIRQVVRALAADPDEVLVPPPGVDSDGARFAVYERVVALIERISDHGPLTIVVDDVQWADATSARCLAFVAGALRERPVAIVLTLRDGEDHSTVRSLLEASARTQSHRHLAVGALDAVAVRELADHVAPSPLSVEEASDLAARTEGNPLFVREYARLPAERRRDDGVPLAVRSVLGRRLAGLPAAVLATLQTAALVEDVIDVALVAAADRTDPGAVADLLDEAADEGFVVAAPGTGGYAFAHGLLRDEIANQLAPARRRRLHLRVAQVLAERREPSRRAQHLLLAQPLADPAEMLDACRQAATDATEHFSFEDAASWWARALQAFDLLPAADRQARERDDLLVAQVEALALAGRGQSMLDLVEDGLLVALRQRRSATAGRLAASLLRATGGWPWVSSGNPIPLLGRLEAGVSLLGEDPAAQARVLAALAVGSSYDPDPRVADMRSGQAIALAEQLGDDDVLADALLGRSLTFSGIAAHCEENLQLLGRLQALPHELSRVDAAIGHSVATMATMMRGDVPAAAEHMRRGIAEAELLRLPVVRVQLRWMQALLAQWHGDLDEADRQIALAAEVHSQTELYHSSVAHKIVLLVMAWERGTLAETTIDAPVETAAWGAAIAAARGERAEAAEQLQRWVAAPGPTVWTTLGHAVLLAHVAADLDLREPAVALAELLAPHEDRIAIIGQCAGTGPVAIAAARLQHLLGNADRAAALLQRAQTLAARTDGRPSALRCRLLAEQLAPAIPDTFSRLTRLAEEAERAGLHGIARDARALSASRS